jgi:hypothetical protein
MSFPQFLGSLTFGGMLGGGLAALIYALVIFPAASTSPLGPFLISGILIGSALHKPIEVVWNFIIGPVFRLAKAEMQILKLYRYKHRGLISEEKFNEFANIIITKDILDGDSKSESLFYLTKSDS